LKLHHLGAREYDPTIGRWLQPDPLGLEGGLNLYAYCGNEPINYIDSSGLMWQWLDSEIDTWGAAWRNRDSVTDAFMSGAEGGYIGWSNGMMHIVTMRQSGVYIDWDNASQVCGYNSGIVSGTSTLVAGATYALGGGTSCGGTMAAWAPPGAAPTFTTGSWVMIGGKTPLNWLLSGTFLRLGYPFGGGLAVPIGNVILKYPTGWEWIKGLWGQRIIG
jgi:hypothetical protein